MINRVIDWSFKDIFRDFVHPLCLDELRGCLPAAGAARQNALESIFKGITKVAIEIRVYDRVQSAIEVTYPEKQQNHRIRAVARLAAQRCR